MSLEITNNNNSNDIDISNITYFSIEVDLCPYGMGISSDTFQCEICLEGYYTIENNDYACRECPSYKLDSAFLTLEYDNDAVSCNGGTNLVITQDYWVYEISNGTLGVDWCLDGFCCQLDDGCNYFDQSEFLCAPNRNVSSEKCLECNEEYSNLVITTSCGDCRNITGWITLLWIIISIIICVCFVLYVLLVEKEEKGDEKFMMTKEFRIKVGLLHNICYWYQIMNIIIPGHLSIFPRILLQILSMEFLSFKNNGSLTAQDNPIWCILSDLDLQTKVVFGCAVVGFPFFLLFLFWVIHCFTNFDKLFKRRLNFANAFTQIFWLSSIPYVSIVIVSPSETYVSVCLIIGFFLYAIALFNGREYMIETFKDRGSASAWYFFSFMIRYIIVCMYLLTPSLFIGILLVVLCVAFQSWFQPFRQTANNILEMACLIALLGIMCCVWGGAYYDETDAVIASLVTLFIIFPLLIWLGIIFEPYKKRFKFYQKYGSLLLRLCNKNGTKNNKQAITYNTDNIFEMQSTSKSSSIDLSGYVLLRENSMSHDTNKTKSKFNLDKIIEIVEHHDFEQFQQKLENEEILWNDDTNRKGETLWHILCNYSESKFIDWLIKQKYDVNGLDKQDNDGWTPLMAAIRNKCKKIVSILCKHNLVDIVETRSNTGKNAIDYAALFGDANIMQMLLSSLFNKNNVIDWDSVHDISDQIFGDIADDKCNINKWIERAKAQDNDQMIVFLEEIKRALKTESFELLSTILNSDDNIGDNEDNDGDSNVSKKELTMRSEEMIKLKQIVKGLTKYCSKSCLNEFSDSVNKMIKNKDVVNDTLMVISVSIKPKEFENVLANTVEDSLEQATKYAHNDTTLLDHATKNEIEYARNDTWYKECIAKSNIFCWLSNNNNKEFEEIKEDNIDRKPKNTKLLFHYIQDRLAKTKISYANKYFIKERIKNENQKSLKKLINCEEFNISWNNIIRQNEIFTRSPDQYVRRMFLGNIMSSNGIEIEYNQSALSKNYKTGFDSSEEYDNHVYLTKLLIAANKINPIFQNDCKNLLTKSMLGVQCEYADAPVKTQRRCQIKAGDYSDRAWPHTSHIVDIVRCSVTFNNPKDLRIGIQKFRFLIYRRQGGCIRRVVREKNSFKNIPNWTKLEDHVYCDVKLNVLIETKRYKMIGEIQFIPYFMLSAKKLGHRFYSFERNKSLYEQLARESVKEVDIGVLTKTIMHKDYQTLSKQILFGRLDHLLFLGTKYGQMIKLCQQNEWEKGAKLLISYEHQSIPK